MLEIIQAIGQYQRSVEEKSLVALWQKDDKVIENVLIYNYNSQDGTLSKDVRQGYEDMYAESLLFQKGNYHVGSGVKIEKYKGDQAEIKKHENKLLSSLEFMEVPEILLPEYSKDIFEYLSDQKGQSFYVMLNKDGQTAAQLYTSKFEEKTKEKSFKLQVEPGTCHMCGAFGVVYGTAVYGFYTNDKEVYSNTEGESSFTICEECLNDILYGRDHIEQYLKTRWLGGEVMFLPHNYRESVASVYNYPIQNNEGVSFRIKTIAANEADVIDEIGQVDSLTDIVFFDAPKARSEWKIQYHIRDVLPSRFTTISHLMKKYAYLNGAPHKLGSIIGVLLNGDLQSREARRFTEAIFKGYPINRNLFFNRVMGKHKTHHYEGMQPQKERHPILGYLQAYNFLVDAGCLEGGWQLMDEAGGGQLKQYETVEELFELNQSYFDTDEKKAWFLLGDAFKALMSLSAYYYVEEIEGEENRKKRYNFVSPIERSFPYGNRFDKRMFQNLAQKVRIKAQAYHQSPKINKNPEARNVHTRCIKQINNACGCMGSCPDFNMNSDEAKFVFFWGKDQWYHSKKIESAKEQE